MVINYTIDGKSVELAEILDSKESRVIRQKQMLEKARALISFTLNIPGSVKVFSLARKAFETGKNEIDAQLKRNNIETKYFLRTDKDTGIEGIWAVNEDSILLKKIMVAIDEYHPLGRLFDIDIISASGNKIDRCSIGYIERKCFLCDNPVISCVRNRNHTVDELLNSVVKIMGTYYVSEFAETMSSIAVKSLLYEVCITPKPGLVDRSNSGSHSDMDIFTFIDSSTVLTSYFRNITLKAFELKNIPPEQLIEHLQFLGIMAEEKMYAATFGVNTHKGIIYSIGILCIACGYLYSFSNGIKIDDIISMCRKIASKQSYRYFNEVSKKVKKTNGDNVYTNHRIKGARGEVSKGFPSVIQFGLPMFKKKILEKWGINSAGVYTLLNLMANINDTNIIARSNMETHELIKERIREILLKDDITEDDFINIGRKLDKDFIRLNISPGGAADLLSVTLMLYFLENNKILIFN